MRNESASGNRIEMSVEPEACGGIGAQVFVYDADELSTTRSSLLGSAGITVSRGYSAGVEATAHLGLGEIAVVDVVVRLPGAGS